ncbi:cysteine-rich repeat secretory protein 38-like [Tripterygium wilfordii]|uniref:cysteine-rich repeat secretory protein 38-like n=1 Tax=Tripterygium wilfordii TaxID=458696 RepID=UPI0018F83CB5|nr:cysteine-rich repeat secretory protein 38-like [Tripterygium wilfordii]
MQPLQETHYTISVLTKTLLHAATAGNPLYNICFNKDNYTTNNRYRNNLNDLLSILAYKASLTGFGLGSVGKVQDYVSGLALCRGDVSSPDCKTCINDASKELLQRCPNNKGAIIWYENCLLKYSNVKFFGKIDYDNKFLLSNVKDVEGDPEVFYGKVKELLSGLANKAEATEKLYAPGDLELNKNEKLYGIVQCTRDLSSADCKKCLDDAMNGLPGCCSGKRGGRIVGGSCHAGYELYPFINQ